MVSFNQLESYKKHYAVSVSVLEGKTGKEIPESSRLELLEKILANKFVLSDADDNTSGPLNTGGMAYLPLLRTLLAIRQKSEESDSQKSDRIFGFISVYQPA